MHRKIPLPRGWKRRVRSSVMHILATAVCEHGTRLKSYAATARSSSENEADGFRERQRLGCIKWCIRRSTRCTGSANFELPKPARFNARHALFQASNIAGPVHQHRRFNFGTLRPLSRRIQACRPMHF